MVLFFRKALSDVMLTLYNDPYNKERKYTGNCRNPKRIPFLLVCKCVKIR